MVFRGSIYLAETDALAQEWFDRQTDRGRAPGIALRSSVSQLNTCFTAAPASHSTKPDSFYRRHEVGTGIRTTLRQAGQTQQR